MSSAVDGRTLRWKAHNASRRQELVADALRAIRRRGAGVGMDELAADLGTSKTVLYRHFGDRNGLYQAVAESVEHFIVAKLDLDAHDGLEPAQLVRELAESYLNLVERDPQIYQFVVNRPPGVPEDPVLSITTRIGNAVSQSLRSWLLRNDLDPEPANTWAHGVVGFVYAVADRWIITQLHRPRQEVVEFIHELFEPAFTAHLRSHR